MWQHRVEVEEKARMGLHCYTSAALQWKLCTRPIRESIDWESAFPWMVYGMFSSLSPGVVVGAIIPIAPLPPSKCTALDDGQINIRMWFWGAPLYSIVTSNPFEENEVTQRRPTRWKCLGSRTDDDFSLILYSIQYIETPNNSSAFWNWSGTFSKNQRRYREEGVADFFPWGYRSAWLVRWRTFQRKSMLFCLCLILPPWCRVPKITVTWRRLTWHI